jgi:hypothetical protein
MTEKQVESLVQAPGTGCHLTLNYLKIFFDALALS